jgi:hypothetical protein
MSPQATFCKVCGSETGRHSAFTPDCLYHRGAGTFTVSKPHDGEHGGPVGFRCLAVSVVAGKHVCLICKPLLEASCP